jgi:peroxiredoxin
MLAMLHPAPDAEAAAGRLIAGSRAPDGPVTLADGRAVPLADLWRDGPVVLAFVRHLGCIFCREAIARLATLHPTLAESGARVVVVTMANPEQADSFCRQRAPGLLCVAEPTADLHRRYGLRQGTVLELAGPASLLAGARATLAGHAQGLGRPIGDPTMLPGTFVIDQRGHVAYAHYAAHAGDQTPTEAIVAAVRDSLRQA